MLRDRYTRDSHDKGRPRPNQEVKCRSFIAFKMFSGIWVFCFAWKFILQVFFGEKKLHDTQRSFEKIVKKLN